VFSKILQRRLAARIHLLLKLSTCEEKGDVEVDRAEFTIFTLYRHSDTRNTELSRFMYLKEE